MGDKSSIEWTDATWNPIVGCSIVSPGCTNCYAMGIAHRFREMYQGRAWSGKPAGGLTKSVNGKAVWTGMLGLAPDHIITAPLRWKRPRRIFVNSMGDLFHEDVPDAWIDRVFAVMALCPQHTFQILTKRAKRMREYMARVLGATEFPRGFRCPPWPNLLNRVERDWIKENPNYMKDIRPLLMRNIRVLADGPLPNVWLGVSCEDQRRADERVPDLLATPAAVRFVSAEPLLGPIDFTMLHHDGVVNIDALNGSHGISTKAPSVKLDWIIAGGESGPGARPMHPDWVRAIRDQCAAAGTAFFFKQWGEHLPWHQFNEAGIDDDPEQTRFKTMEWEDGRWNDVGYPMWCDSTDGNIDDENCVARVGKKRAGRLLDGLEHNGYPG